MTQTTDHDIPRLAADVSESVIGWQRTIHAEPEIGFDTFKTAALAAGVLRDAGIDVREQIGRTGVVGDIDVPAAERRIAFRADMDALPMDEETDLPHKSTIPGAAHMCGHDAHTSMLLGAATVLSKLRDSLPCSLRFIFQPNEESLPGGAPGMIEDGCLEGVDRIFGMHVWPTLDTGNVGILEGPTMAQPDTWRIEITGVGGHAATPHEVKDPVVAAAHIVTALQTVVARNVDPLDSAVMSVTQIHTGSADNVIPEKAEILGTIRTFKEEVGVMARRRLREIAEGIAHTLGVEATVEVTLGYPVLVNDGDACDAAEQRISPLLPIDRNMPPTLGGEDFAYYLQHVPGAFLMLGNRDLEKGIQYFCHHPKFQVDDAAMPLGVQVWLALALNAT